VFLSGGDIATVCDVDETLRRLRRGVKTPWRMPGRMQVRFMNQAATTLRLAQDSALSQDRVALHEALL
jgi:hypothetical protein